MTTAPALTPLGIMILQHWREYRPRRTAYLEQTDQLLPSIEAAQEMTSDLFYELLIIQKISYPRAWEIASREWAILPDEDG